MIVFNGKALESVARVMVEDIKVTPIQYKPVSRPRAVRFGSEFVRMGGGERRIVVTLALLEKEKTIRHESFMRVSQWARTDAEYCLELPTDSSRALWCVCTGKPEPSTRAWWENKLRLTFTCFSNPYWTKKVSQTVACGTEFFVQGDAPPLMQIVRTFNSSTTNKTYSNGTQSMTFSTVPAGDLVIDLNAQTAQVGTTSIMQYYQPSGSFLIPKTGRQTITGTGNVVYRERWE